MKDRMDKYRLLAEITLPEGIPDWFDVTDVRVVKKNEDERALHIYLDENADKLDNLRPNGFTRESVFTDFPLRGQEVRREYRREQMTRDAIAREEHKIVMRELQEEEGPFVDADGNPVRRNARYYPKRMENGETRAELLARSKGLLMMSPDKWTDTQKERADIVPGVSGN